MLGAALGGSWGSEGGLRKRGCTPLWQQDCATPRNHQAQDVPPGRGQCAQGSRDGGLGGHHFVLLLLGKGQTLVWVHRGGQERRKSPSPRHWRAVLGRGCSVRLGLASVALGDGTWLTWLYGTAVSPCSSQEPILVFSCGAEDAPAHQGQGEAQGPPVPSPLCGRSLREHPACSRDEP